MRRLMAITAFAVILAVPAWAQRGGGGGHGGGGFGGHAGFSGGHAGFSGGHVSSGRSFGGMRSAPAFNRGFAGHPLTRSFSRGPFLHDGLHANGFNRFGTGFNHFGTFNSGFGFNNRFGRFGNRFGNCWGRGCNWNNWGWGWGGWGWGWGWPWWGWGDDYNNYDQDYYNNLATAQQMNEQNLEEQEMLRREQAEGDQDAYAPRAPRQQAQAPAPQAEAQPLPNTVLVFRDQHKLEVANYAIVGQTLWAFSPQHQKIPLSELDVPATEKANDERGVEFRVPSTNQGQ